MDDLNEGKLDYLISNVAVSSRIDQSQGKLLCIYNNVIQSHSFTCPEFCVLASHLIILMKRWRQRSVEGDIFGLDR